MVALIIGTIFYIALFIVAAYFVNERITRDVKDEKIKREYRK